MVRLLLSGKWVALSLLVLICVASFSWLGSWQWSRAHPATTQPTANQEPVSLREVHTPGQPVSADAVGQNVRATGKYRSDEQLLVPGRTVGEASDAVGFWVLTPLILADGSVLPVVRGWVSSVDSVESSTVAGRVVVTGFLEPTEDETQRAGLADVLPAGQISAVSSAELLSLWQGDQYEGFVLLQRQRPEASITPVVVDTESAEAGFSLQSFAYAIQWWLFAVFAVFLWWRMFMADWQDRQNGDMTANVKMSEAYR